MIQPTLCRTPLLLPKKYSQSVHLLWFLLIQSNLFTNVPLQETIEICLDKLFHDTDTVRNLTRDQLKRLLTVASKENHFLFNGMIYDQIDGVAMGSPLGPVLANIFMSHLEKHALDTYQGQKPLFYKRYVDDIFLVFSSSADVSQFFQWINAQHPQIRFTLEEEQDDKISFLDVLVSRQTDGKLLTSVFRKPTFSGLYLRWDSFVPKMFKRGLVYCLVSRAWRLCSNYHLFHEELLFIKNVLLSNGYPGNFVDSCVQRFLNRAMGTNTTSTIFGPERMKIYLSLPYAGLSSMKLCRQLKRIYKAVLPCVELLVIFKPSCKLNRLCKLKSSYPRLTCSNVIYKVNCKDCSDFYVGLTTRRLDQRMKEHASSDSSALFKHQLETDHSIGFDLPDVLASDVCKTRLFIKESLKILELKAFKSLNGNQGSFELKLW